MPKNNIVTILIILVVAAALVYIVQKFFLKDNEVETETLYCGPDKTKPVKVFKNPTKAFPSFAKEYTTEITTGLNIADSLEQRPGIKGNGSLSLNDKIVELREKLNQESSRMEMIMKSNFLAYNSNPCDSVISKNYFSVLNVIIENNSAIEKLRAELTMPVSKGANKNEGFTVVSDTLKIHSELEKFLAKYKP